MSFYPWFGARAEGFERAYVRVLRGLSLREIGLFLEQNFTEVIQVPLHHSQVEFDLLGVVGFEEYEIAQILERFDVVSATAERLSAEGSIQGE